MQPRKWQLIGEIKKRAKPQSFLFTVTFFCTDLLRRLKSSLSVLSLADSSTCRILLTSLQASWPRAMKALSVVLEAGTVTIKDVLINDALQYIEILTECKIRGISFNRRPDVTFDFTEPINVSILYCSATFVGNWTCLKRACIYGMSNRVQYEGLASEKFTKSSLPMPNSTFCR